MDYINEIRKLVGHRSIILVGTTLLALNDQDQLLMLKRTDNNCWGVPGGAMEPGERIEDTLKREAQEETGLEIEGAELFGIYSGPEQHYRYPGGDEVDNVSIVYLARNIGNPSAVNPAEHSEYQFFDLNHLPAEISPPIRPIISDLCDRELKS